MAKTYTVQWGDTLSQIALNNNTTVDALVMLNSILDPDYIVVGQVIKLSGEATVVKKNTSTRANITLFGLQTNTTNTVYATWSFDKANVENYQLEWKYSTGDGVWFDGNTGTTTSKQSTYGAPSNAKSVKFRVKPISKTKKDKNGKETSYWTASWSVAKTYSFSDNPPLMPAKPTANLTDKTLKVVVNDATGVSIIQFDVAKNDSPGYKKIKVAVTETGSATLECQIDLGNKYKVRCRSCKKDVYSDWSAWSDEITTVPIAPKEITECKVASDEKSISLKWTSVATATTYKVQYTLTRSDFTSATPSGDLKTISDIKTNSCTITDTTVGKEYFVRVLAVNDKGESAWSSIKSTVVAKGPSAPTTWSSVTSANVGDLVTLYWQHNAEGETAPTYSDIALYVDGSLQVIPTQDHTKDDGTVEEGDTKDYTIDTTEYDDGASLQWRVRTANAAKEYGAWSSLRLINVYNQPDLSISLSNSQDVRYEVDANNYLKDTIKGLPIRLIATVSAGSNQTAIGYSVTIKSNETYETIDNLGNKDIINENEVVYSMNFDTLDKNDPDSFTLNISAGDVNLDPNVSYTVTCSVAMDSGLKAEKSLIFSTEWTETTYDVNAEIGYDEATFTATIMPYCKDSSNELIEDMRMFVYRREYDGKFKLIGGDIANDGATYVYDPHPALDYARYRIVAMSNTTGAILYSDIPGYYIGCKSVVIQWDEPWSTFDVLGDIDTEPAWSGSLLELIYNIDVSDNNNPDVEFVEYIGRENPVSYYGTHHGESSTWNTVIPKSDRETLYALRRLSKWMGDVYVREPYGTGYWANVKVSFDQKHDSLTIPITMDVTKVEGGA